MFRDLCPALANKTYFNQASRGQEASNRSGFWEQMKKQYQRFYQRTPSRSESEPSKGASQQPDPQTHTKRSAGYKRHITA